MNPLPASAGPLEPAIPGPYGVAPAGYRLPDSAHVGGVRLQVANLERSAAWYRGVLGFALLDQRANHASLGVAGASTALIELTEYPGALPPPRRGRLGLFHFAILLPDRAALGRFLSHQVAAGTALGASDHLVSEALYLNDPDGLGIEVYADRPRSAWQRRGAELAMATNPLDGASVRAEAGGRPWDGMPRGTTIGHVHLHIGDLARAAGFYHTALGLDLMVWSYPGALFLAAGGYHHHLGLNTWAGADAVPARADEARLLEWELVLPGPDDLRALIEALAAQGQPATNENRGLLVRDPWGTALRIRSAG